MVSLVISVNNPKRTNAFTDNYHSESLTVICPVDNIIWFCTLIETRTHTESCKSNRSLRARDDATSSKRCSRHNVWPSTQLQVCVCVFGWTVLLSVPSVLSVVLRRSFRCVQAQFCCLSLWLHSQYLNHGKFHRILTTRNTSSCTIAIPISNRECSDRKSILHNFSLMTGGGHVDLEFITPKSQRFEY